MSGGSLICFLCHKVIHAKAYYRRLGSTTSHSVKFSDIIINKMGLESVDFSNKDVLCSFCCTKLNRICKLDNEISHKVSTLNDKRLKLINELKSITMERYNTDTPASKTTSTPQKAIKSSSVKKSDKTNKRPDNVNRKPVYIQPKPETACSEEKLCRPKCDVCGITLSSLFYLNLHINETHNGEKPYKCGICSKAFTESRICQEHMKIHTEDEPYTCGVCGKMFFRAGSLQSHVRTHSGKKLYTEKHFCACGVCGKLYKYLQTHIKIHTGEKPFKCDVCYKPFSLFHYMRLHMRIHTGQRLYECDVCGNSYFQEKDFQTHIIIHAREKALNLR